MGDVERLTQLAALQSLYKLLGEVLSPKNPDSLRGQVDSNLIELYETAGVDRLRLTLDGEEVGRLTLKLSKPTTRTTVFVNDVDALLDGHEDEFRAFVAENPQVFAEWLYKGGTVPFGCEISTEEVPAKVVGTTITGCKPEKVLPMLGIGTVAGYLEEV